MTLLLDPSIVRAGGKPPPEHLFDDRPENPDAGSDDFVFTDTDTGHTEAPQPTDED